ncbi:SRPBCC domain-containing protein [Blastococcus sp. PRF04-17]|uniref:SRPBCC domain-containing protein n=1 Tax=Blastococcus sp. PRF04-17 TaxID=2933797 RepID=UPI001FF62435|nr:SRPBCC domain-containing protein [Blastococcus sp. PRF04-17]UOY02543.1 SRPBCC domain-containing protein [Blastococcus sp. PRF04-17]
MTAQTELDNTATAVDRALGRLTPQRVREGTGRDWAEWLGVLDAAGARDWDHRGIVDFLEREHPDVPGWWQQSLAVAYERARGKRVTGRTAGALHVGAQRSVATSSAHLWKVLVSRPDLWLGDGAAVVFEPGEHYHVPPGELWARVTGEIVVVKPGDRLRMSWQPEDWPTPATLQIALTPTAPGRTRLNASLENLPDVQTRDVLRARMHDAMERVALAAEQ